MTDLTAVTDVLDETDVTVDAARTDAVPAVAGPADRSVPRPPIGRRYLTVWAGQTVSAVGSTVSGVGAAIYVFLDTKSAVWLGVISALAVLPQVLACPFMTIVDRLPRRTMMIAGDTVAALGPAVALGLALSGRLEVWHLVAASFVGGIGSAFQAPAAQAAVPLLVDGPALGRANGLGQLGPAAGIVVGPLLAAPLVATWGIASVLLVDLVTFAVAVATVLAVPFAEPVEGAGDGAPATSHDRGWAPALAWLRGPGRPMATLLVTAALVNAMLALFNVALLALATSIGGAARAGVPLAAIGVALVVGSIVAGVRGVADDRVLTLARGLWVMAAGCVVVAARANLAVLVVGGAVAVVFVPAINAASATLFQERVPAALHGRIFGLRAAVGGALYPVGAVAAGFLIAEVGAPAIDAGGPLAGTLGRLIGVGPDRGAAVIVLAAGGVLALVGTWLSRSRVRAVLRAGVGVPAAAP